MLDQVFKDRFSVERARWGPHFESFAASLAEEGYADSTVWSKLQVVSGLGQWMGRNEIEATALNDGLVGGFLDERQRQGRPLRGYARTASQFLDHLRSLDAVAPPTPVCDTSAAGVLQSRYETYLRAERGLTTATVVNYLPFVRRFLIERFGDGPLSFRDLTPSDVSRFILYHADCVSAGRAKLMVTALRSFFRFLLQRGEIDVDLAASVPTVADWRLSTVPKYLAPEEVERVLGAVDRRTSTGRRNYAILLLLAHLGLRAGEVVALDLEDIDWRAGEILVRGKGLLCDRLPLLPEVGEALATYLHTDRPKSPTRRVFVRMQAPWRGFAGPSSIATMVRRALERAGLHPPTKGAHLLRHSLATKMLQRGASMAEIGELLRHRAPTTTEIYAKVDVRGLRSLAQPSPRVGGGA